MRHRLGLFLLALSLAMILLPSAAKQKRPLILYVLGQPFQGEVIVSGHEIYAEARPLAEALGFPAGHVFPRDIQRVFSGKTFVSLLGVAQMHAALLNINWGTRIVDLYTPQQPAPTGPTIVMLPPSESAQSPQQPVSSYPPTSGPGMPAQNFNPGMPLFPGFPYFYPYPFLYPSYTYFSLFVPRTTPIWINLPPGVHWNGAFFQDAEGHVVPMTSSGVPRF